MHQYPSAARLSVVRQMTSKMGDLREMRAVTGRLCHGEEGGTTMGTKKCEVEIEGERIAICFEAGK